MSLREAAANANRQRHAMICSGSLGRRPRGGAGGAAAAVAGGEAEPPLAAVAPVVAPPPAAIANVAALAPAAVPVATPVATPSIDGSGHDGGIAAGVAVIADAGGGGNCREDEEQDEPVTGLYYDYCLALLHGWVKVGLHLKAKGAVMKDEVEKLQKIMVDWIKENGDGDEGELRFVKTSNGRKVLTTTGAIKGTVRRLVQKKQNQDSNAKQRTGDGDEVADFPEEMAGVIDIIICASTNATAQKQKRRNQPKFNQEAAAIALDAVPGNGMAGSLTGPGPVRTPYGPSPRTAATSRGAGAQTHRAAPPSVGAPIAIHLPVGDDIGATADDGDHGSRGDDYYNMVTSGAAADEDDLPQVLTARGADPGAVARQAATEAAQQEAPHATAGAASQQQAQTRKRRRSDVDTTIAMTEAQVSNVLGGITELVAARNGTAASRADRDAREDKHRQEDRDERNAAREDEAKRHKDMMDLQAKKLDHEMEIERMRLKAREKEADARIKEAEARAKDSEASKSQMDRLFDLLKESMAHRK